MKKLQSGESPTGGPSGPAGLVEGAGELVISSFGGTWGQAIQLGLIDSFERETGIKVTLRSGQDAIRSADAVRNGAFPPDLSVITKALKKGDPTLEGLLVQV